MRRALVLTNEAARHPFRQSLPASIFSVRKDDDTVTMATPSVAPRFSMKLGEDAGFFAASFAAGFVLFYGFII